jgi:hypothetical protein
MVYGLLSSMLEDATRYTNMRDLLCLLVLIGASFMTFYLLYTKDYFSE